MHAAGGARGMQDAPCMLETQDAFARCCLAQLLHGALAPYFCSGPTAIFAHDARLCSRCALCARCSDVHARMVRIFNFCLREQGVKDPKKQSGCALGFLFCALPSFPHSWDCAPGYALDAALCIISLWIVSYLLFCPCSLRRRSACPLLCGAADACIQLAALEKGFLRVLTMFGVAARS